MSYIYPNLPSRLCAFALKTVRILSSVFYLLCVATIAQARLGDTFADISKHRGKPVGKPDKNKAVWAFEGGDEQLLYAVRFDDAGKSIGETLKPSRNGAPLDQDIVLDFIKAQREVLGDSKTTRELKPGTQYTFAGQTMVVGANESVLVDEPHGFLLVWLHGSLPSVTVVSPAALQ